MRVLGLTGGVASGKSTVAVMLQELGAVVIDADVLSRQAVAPGAPALAEIAARYGPGVLHADGTLNRQALGRLVFSDAAERRALEHIVHPRVFAAMAEALAAERRKGTAVTVLDIPLLFETRTGLQFCDCTAVVWVPPEIQLARLQARNRLSRAEALQRIAAQMPLAEKAKLADWVIDNSGSLTATKEQVVVLWKHLSGAACLRPPGGGRHAHRPDRP
jgi:dephospho-CoA kinase